ncbi:PilZ domain-containing protein [Vibrio sonorensis]|uniref:PilZ domain-containing protein n=1 Tax=Vibrio sonorensis TaxID=1004316 RepID=UPI0008D94441|nr:flagellar brake protein [Vibrio sonorensis]
MNSQAAVVKDNPGTASPQEKRVSTLNSTDALAMVEHGSEMTIGITTPVGTTFRCKTNFIGFHSQNLVMIELPKVSHDDLEFFFQEGFWMAVRAISPRGEGAVVHFRSQLLYVINAPVPMAAISVPQTMQVTQLRKEPRYDVNLAAKIISATHKADCEVRDLSKSGCRFITPPLAKTFQVGEEVALEVTTGKRGEHFAPLYGKICNLQRSTHYARYGVAFNEKGRNNAKNLLGHLKFDGTRLSLR